MHSQADKSLYRSLFDHNADGILIVEIETRRFKSANLKICEMFGYSGKEFLSLTVEDIHPRAMFQFVISEFKRCTENKKSFVENIPCLRKDGTIFFSDINTALLKNDGISYSTGTFRDVSERKHIEDMLRKSHAMLARTEHFAHIGSWEWDVETDHINWSKELSHFFQRDPAEEAPSFAELSKLFVPEDAQILQKAVERCITDGIPYELELHAIRTDGEIRNCIARGQTDTDANGRIKLVGFSQDITERKQVEEDLRKSEQQHRIIMEASLQGMYQVNAEGRFTFVNQAMVKLTGYPLVELNGMPLDTIFPPGDSKKIKDANIAILLSGNSLTGENRLARKDGSWIDTYFSCAPVFDEKGEYDGLIGSIIDITDHKRSVESLRIEKEFTETALNAQQDTFFLFEITTGKAIRWNRSFNDITGYTNEEIALIPAPASYYTPYDLERAGVFIQDILEKGIGTIELNLICKDGRMVPTEYKASVINDEEGKPKYLISIGRDITERKQAEENKKKLEAQLQQAQKMESIGHFAGGVAHDFNNMLGVILGHVQLAIEHVDQDQPLLARLTGIHKAARRSADLTRQLLAFARKQTIEPKVLDLNKTIESMLKMLRRLIGEDIEFIWLPKPNLWPVKIDPSQLDQILANLCINSRDAIADVGKIIIETRKGIFDEEDNTNHPGLAPGEYVQLIVSDSGYGIDKETLPHIFEPFFTTKGIDKGTGLGLASVYGAVKQNRGFINAYSEPGHGTTITIYLPRYVGEADQERMESVSGVAKRGHETILLVEDDPSILDIGKEMLESLGYTILPANTPGEAIRLAEEHAGNICLLLTDVIMPTMNGRSLAKKLLDIYPNLKSLFMSGYPADVITDHGVLDEGVNFIQKPFSLKELAAKVRQVFEQ